MNEIMKLYYYELMKNKNKIFAVLIAVLIFNAFMISSVYLPIFYELPIGEFRNIVSIFIKNTSTPESLKILLEQYAVNSIDYQKIGSSSFILIYYYGGSLFCVLMSIDIVSRSYKKKNKSFYIEYLMPVKIAKLKISKIMFGFSLYLLFQALMNISAIAMNFVLGQVYKNTYNSSLALLSKIGYNTFFPTNFSRVMIVTFVIVFASVVYTQTITSIVYINEGKNTFKNKILFCLLLLLFCVIMGGLIILTEKIEIKFYYDNQIVINALVLAAATVLFFIDCIMTKNRVRGGI
ncbi:hypothetical protein [Peptostreptococcus sp. D1]|uniref:hypothetical protein n=1 Tax=Peptostreptococcus sp. D1 TaxID=72304 RepID=UPI0008E0000D|nr:hypothetical protein [Peptostreptococcus sp. D1]SFE44210.1 hypothetical protein SAMN02910278_00851 [Peptostreptococcus sp. D1]